MNLESDLSDNFSKEEMALIAIDDIEKIDKEEVRAEKERFFSKTSNDSNPCASNNSCLANKSGYLSDSL